MAQTKEVKSLAKAEYTWQGVNKRGKRIKGSMPADSIDAVRSDLRRQGIKPLKVRKSNNVFKARKPAIKSKDIAVFSRMLATMVSSGVPLMQSLEIIGSGHENASMKTLVLSIADDVKGGSSLAEGMAKFPLYFDDLFLSLVEAGEKSGTLERLLGEIADYQEKTEAIKSKVRKAMVYPAAIIAVAFIVTAILMIFVIPQFEALFQGFGADLPALTSMVVKVSEFFREKWWLMLIIIVGSIYAIIQARRRSEKVHHFLDRMLLKLPILGEILRKSAIARFARTTSTMFTAGVPLVEAMDSVAGSTGNIVYNHATLEMKEEVATGTQLNRAMADTNLFPNMMIQMTAIGEESGSLDTMLAKVADFFEQEVDDAVDNLTALLEPLIMVILGTLIGTLVIAMYLPIFKLGSVIG